MTKDDLRTIIVSDIKKFCFIAISSSLLTYVVGAAYSLNLVHFAVIYCGVSVLSVFIFRRQQKSRYLILLFLLFGFVLAFLRAIALSDWVSPSLSFVIVLVVATAASMLTIVLDLMLSKQLSID
ncbi:MAG: hypothetical protein ACRD6X_19400 [Pyrinomonadaceae bacterium]